MKLRTGILNTGKTTTGIEVPAEMVAALGAGKRPAVAVTLNGYTYRTSIAAMGGRFLVSVSADVRQKANVKGGDLVEVDIVLDTAPREVVVPADLAAALDEAPEARAIFDRLAYSHKLRHVLAIEDAKTPETRQRRVTKAVEMLLQPK